jgi:hypothetical protein
LLAAPAPVAARLLRTYKTFLEQNDVLPCAGKPIRSADANNSTANDHTIGLVGKLVVGFNLKQWSRHDFPMCFSKPSCRIPVVCAASAELLGRSFRIRAAGCDNRLRSRVPRRYMQGQDR